MNRPLLIYCYDAYCGWCYGFSAVMQELERRFRGRVQIEVVSGGMLRGDTVMPIASIAPFIAGSYRKVEEATGIRFGEEFLWHIRNPDLSDWTMDSTLPAVALCVFRDYFPDQQVAFATALQQALFAEGRDLCDIEAYRDLLLRLGIPPEQFFEKMNAERYRLLAEDDFLLCRRLKVSGFPAVFLQESEQKVYQLCCGYTPYEKLAGQLEAALKRLAEEKGNP
jgi:putative protein-disulfide isomerase